MENEILDGCGLSRLSTNRYLIKEPRLMLTLCVETCTQSIHHVQCAYMQFHSVIYLCFLHIIILHPMTHIHKFEGYHLLR